MPKTLVVARGGLVAFVALVALEHPLRSDLPPRAHFISEYAIGSTRPLAVAAFVAWGSATAAGAVLGWRHGLRAAPVLLALATAGTLLCAAFTTQTVAGELPPGTVRTAAGRAHDDGTLLILVGLLGAALAGLRGVPTRRYRLGVLAAAAALVLAPGVLVASGRDWPGVGQRAIILVGVGWQALWVSELARRARRTPARARA